MKLKKQQIAKKKIAIIRALDVRLIQAEYSNTFTKFDSYFVSHYVRNIENYFKKKSRKYISLKLTPAYFIDPVGFLFGNPVQQSWLVFEKEGIDRCLRSMDIFQLQEPFFLYSGQVAEIAKKYSKPLVLAPWTCFNHISTYIPPYALNVKKSLNQADLIILRTEHVTNYLDRFKIPSRKKLFVYHGVNIERFTPSIKKTDMKVRILFVGALDQSKGIDDLLDIFPRLLRKNKVDIELVVCGGGRLVGRLERMAKTLPIRYLGYVDNVKMPVIYRNCDIFCGPSKNGYFLGIQRSEEGFGFVFLEAMASGLPVVTNDCGAIKEVVGENNFVNNQGDKEALLHSLNELINDGNMRRNIGYKNRKRVEKMFDIRKQVSEEEKEFRKRF